MAGPIQIDPVTVSLPRRNRQRPQRPTRDEVLGATRQAIDTSMGTQSEPEEDIDASPALMQQDAPPDPGERSLIIPRTDPDQEESIDDSLISPHASVQAISAPNQRTNMQVQRPPTTGIDASPNAMRPNPMVQAQQQVNGGVPPIASPTGPWPRSMVDETWEPDLDASPQVTARETQAPQAPSDETRDALDASPNDPFAMTPEERVQLEAMQKRQRRERIAGGVIAGLGGLIGLGGAIAGSPVAAGVGSAIAGGGATINAAKPGDAMEEQIRQRQQMGIEREDREQRRQMLGAQLQQQSLQGQALSDQMQQRQFDREQGQNAALGSYRQYRNLAQLIPEDQRADWDIPVEEWPQSPEEARHLLDDLQSGFRSDRRGTHWIGGGISPRQSGLVQGGGNGPRTQVRRGVTSSIEPGSARQAGEDIINREFSDPNERLIAQGEVAGGYDPRTSDGLNAIRAQVAAYREAGSGGRPAILQRAREELRGQSGASPQLQAQVEHLRQYMTPIHDAERTVRRIERPLSNLSDDQVQQVVQAFTIQNGHASIIGDAESLGLNNDQNELLSQLTHMFNVTLKERSGAAVTPNEMGRLIREFASFQGHLSPRRMLTFVHQLGEAAAEDAADAEVTYADAWDEYNRRLTQRSQRQNAHAR